MTDTRIPTVVVVLPLIREKVLMQLRDFKRGIAYPGHWGFFGGKMNKRETSLEAALREIKEEINVSPKPLCLIGTDSIPNHNFSYIYSFKLNVPLNELQLNEGIDFDLISLNDIKKKKFFSKKLGKFFPIVPLPFIAETINKCLGKNINY